MSIVYLAYELQIHSTRLSHHYHTKYMVVIEVGTMQQHIPKPPCTFTIHVVTANWQVIYATGEGSVPNLSTKVKSIHARLINANVAGTMSKENIQDNKVPISTNHTYFNVPYSLLIDHFEVFVDDNSYMVLCCNIVILPILLQFPPKHFHFQGWQYPFYTPETEVSRECNEMGLPQEYWYPIC